MCFQDGIILTLECLVEIVFNVFQILCFKCSEASVLFFNIRIDSHSRDTHPLPGEGLRYAAGGGTSNRKHGDLVTQ